MGGRGGYVVPEEHSGESFQGQSSGHKQTVKGQSTSLRGAIVNLRPRGPEYKTERATVGLRLRPRAQG